MYKVNEIKSWAKQHGFVVKKKDEGYVWFEEKEKLSEEHMPKEIELIVIEIFNKITDNKFLDHQKNYKTVT